VLAATIVMAIATVLLMLFTVATWRILWTQHKLYNDPELIIHPWPELATTTGSLLIIALGASDREKRSNAQYVEYRFALVNRGRVPIMVMDITENVLKQEGGHEPVRMRFPYFRKPGRPEVMAGVPWLIAAQQYAICWRFLSFYGQHERLKDQDFSIKATFRYHNGRRQVTTTGDAVLRWGFDAPFPGDSQPPGAGDVLD
jgi:hypothetical protein